MDLDPRTLLPLAAVPATMLPAFASIQGCVFHWIGPVRLILENNAEKGYVGIVGDSAVYVCDRDAQIHRCLLLAHVHTLFTRGDDDTIGFRMDDAYEDGYDCAIRLGGQRDVSFVLVALRRIYWVHMGCDLPVTSLGPSDPITPRLRLRQPPGWVSRLEPLHRKRQLEKLMSDFRVAQAKHAEAAHDEFVRIKNELWLALQSLRNEQYDRMVHQCAAYLQSIADSEARVQRLQEALELVRGSVIDASVKRSIDAALSATAGDQQRAVTTAQLVSSTTAAVPSAPAEGGDAQQGQELCPNCARLKRLLDNHPMTDKRRLLEAEENARKAELHAQRSALLAAPLKEELRSIEGVLARVDGILRDEHLSLNDRVRAASALTSPHAAVIAKRQAANRGNGATENTRDAGVPVLESMPAALSVEELTREVAMLRGVVRDATSLHLAELDRLRSEFDAYDSALIAAVRQALESGVVSGIPLQPRDAAEKIVNTERARVLQSVKGPLDNNFSVSTTTDRRSVSPLLSRPSVLHSTLQGYSGSADMASNRYMNYSAAAPSRRMVVDRRSLQSSAYSGKHRPNTVTLDAASAQHSGTSTLQSPVSSRLASVRWASP